MKINVLGTEYTIVKGSAKEYPHLNNCDGYCDTSIKRIVIIDLNTVERDVSHIADFKSYEKKVIRHEVFHAFFNESGLWVNTNDVEQWSMNEEMIDWLAIQSPKIFKTLKEADLL